MTIFHLALEEAWAEALARGEYRRSTIDQTLDEVGFIHCSFPAQVQGVADRYYRDRDDVVLLTIDPARVGVDLVVENTSGGTEGFPHLYGALPVSAVERTDPVPLGADGRLVLDGLVPAASD